MPEKLSVEQMARNLLSRAVEDRLLRTGKMGHPLDFTAGDIVGVANLLHEYLGAKPSGVMFIPVGQPVVRRPNPDSAFWHLA